MEKLHPGVKWQFRIGTYVAMLFLALFFGWLVVPAGYFIFSFFGLSIGTTFMMVLFGILLYLVLIVVVGEIYARMAYNRWFWEFNEEGLRLERGVIWKRYSNVPYERMQNIDLTRGILARMLGFSSLMIQTAGYSGHPQAEGYIPALEMNRAEQLREFVMKKITKRRK